MAHRANVWIGFTIGLLAALLVAALLVLFVPQLRELVSPVDVPTNEPEQEQAEPVRLESENIYVSAPQPQAAIQSPVTVSGEARVFENTVNIRIRDDSGRVLAETTTTAQSPDVGLFGPFSVSLAFGTPTSSTGTVEVFWLSARDGSETDTVTIPVRFGS